MGCRQMAGDDLIARIIDSRCYWQPSLYCSALYGRWDNLEQFRGRQAGLTWWDCCPMSVGRSWLAHRRGQCVVPARALIIVITWRELAVLTSKNTSLSSDYKHLYWLLGTLCLCSPGDHVTTILQQFVTRYATLRRYTRTKHFAGTS